MCTKSGCLSIPVQRVFTLLSATFLFQITESRQEPEGVSILTNKLTLRFRPRADIDWDHQIRQSKQQLDGMSSYLEERE